MNLLNQHLKNLVRVTGNTFDFNSLQFRLLAKVVAVFAIAIVAVITLTRWEVQSLSMMVKSQASAIINFATLLFHRLMMMNILLMSILLLVVIGLIQQSLSPFRKFSHWVVSSANQLQPYPITQAPGEIKPLVRHWNETLTMLANTKQQQRQFTNDVSHELRSPLSLVYGYLQSTLRRSQNLSASQRETLSMATIEAERMTVILQNLLDLARVDDLDASLFQEPLILNQVVRDIAEMAEKFEHHPIQIETASTPIWIQSNRDCLMQVLNHLIQNAIQHSEDDAPIVVRVTRSDHSAIIQVSDRGSGIAPSQQAAIFEPFYRVDPSRNRATGGAGLGLAIVRSLVTQMGGTITLESTLGQGSTFSLMFPISGVSP